MTKSEVARKVAAVTGRTVTETTSAIDHMTNIIMEAVSSGEKVTFAGFGVFDMTAVGARMGRNPSTGESVMIEAKNRPRFRASKEFKSFVN